MVSDNDSFTFVDASPSRPSRRPVKFVAKTVDHFQINFTDASSIRVFLRTPDQYAREVEERALKLIANVIITAEVVTTVHLRYGKEPERIESIICYGVLGVCRPMTSWRVKYFKPICTIKLTSRRIFTLDTLGGLLSKELRLNLSDSDAKYRIEN